MSERSLFIQALEITDPGQRAALLDNECARDPGLRQRVEKLLAAHAAAGGILDKSPVESPPTDLFRPITEGPGTQIGPYKVLEQIGDGGFGVVFMAEQLHPVRRKVALKVIKPGMDTRQVIARFEAERQALALMDHPHIARVFDAGETETGRPYFVMELVKGVPITQFCDEAQLTARERLALFVGVCQAVQHAHQKGIIHRDLKPSNVLVTLHDGTPVVKVIDFGVAKATGQQLTEKTLFTGFAQMIGTPLYMSPEQAALSGLDIDTRSDVYSLGVLLYELLTGTTPLAGEKLKKAAFDEIRRMIREEEPQKPSTRVQTMGASASTVSAQRKTEPGKLQQLLRNDLDWIVMKALEKDRTRRYETASGLSRDVLRYLEDQPVEACPPSAFYRISKFIRRNKVAFTTGSLITASALIGLVASTIFAIDAYAQRNQVRRHLADVEVHRRNAEQSAKVAIDREQDAIEAQMEAEAQKRSATERAKQAELAKQAEADLRAVAEEKRRAIEVQKTEIEGLNSALQRTIDEAHRSLYAAQINLIPAAWEGDNIPRIRELLQATRPRPGQEDLRGFEWFYWNRLCNSELQTSNLANYTAFSSAFHPTFSADGSRLAGTSLDSATTPDGRRTRGVRLQVWEAASGRELWSHSQPLGSEAGQRISSGWDGRFFNSGARLSSDGTHVALWSIPRLAPGLRRQISGSPRPVASDGETPHLEVSMFEVGNVNPLFTIRVPIARTGEIPTPFVDVAFSQDGLRVVTGVLFPSNQDQPAHGALQLWNMQDGQPVAKIELSPPKNSGGRPGFGPEKLPLAVSHDGGRVAACLADGITVWSVATGEIMRQFPDVRAEWFDFSPDGNRLAATSGYRLAATPENRLAATSQNGIWDIATGTSVPLEDGNARVVAAFSPDGKWLAATSPEYLTCVQLYSAFTGAKGPRIKGHRSLVTTAQFSIDGGQLMTAAMDGTVKQWSVSEVVEAEGLLGRGSLTRISPDGASFASAATQDVSLCEFSSGRVIGRIKTSGSVKRLIYSGSGNYLAVVSCATEGDVSTAGEIRVVDATSGDEIGSPRRAAVFEPTIPANLFPPSPASSFTARRNQRVAPSVALSPDGRILAYSVLSSADGQPFSELRIVDTTSQKTIATGPPIRGILDSWTFSADGAIALAQLNPGVVSGRSASSVVRGTLAVYDAKSAQLLWRGREPIDSAAFSGDGEQISAVSFSRQRGAIRGAIGPLAIKIWDASSGIEQISIPLPIPAAVAREQSTSFFSAIAVLSPDRRRIVSSINVWDRENPAEVDIRIWDAITGRQLSTLRGHTAPVSQVAFTPDGRRIATSASVSLGPARSRTKETKVWDAQTGQELLSLYPTVDGLTFASGGRKLIGEQRIFEQGIWMNRLVSWDATSLDPDRESVQIVEHLTAIEVDGSPLSRSEMLRHLDADASINPATVRLAQEHVRGLRRDILKLAANDIMSVFDSHHDLVVYQRLLDMAQEAIDGRPADRLAWNIRGYAFYRLGHYESAINALEEAERIRSEAEDQPIVASMVFHAMTLQRLGKSAAAADRLREAARTLDLQIFKELEARGRPQSNEQRAAWSPAIAPHISKLLLEAEEQLGIELAVLDSASIDGWGQAVNPSKQCQVQNNGGKLTLSIPAKVHDLNPKTNDLTAPRVLQKVLGDFALQVKVSCELNPQNPPERGALAYHGAGLLLWSDPLNFLRIERNAYRLTADEGFSSFVPSIEAVRNGVSERSKARSKGIGFTERSTWLRVERRGDAFTTILSHDGERWSEPITTKMSLPERLWVGVAAVNYSRDPFAAEFSDFTLSPLPAAIKP